MSELSIIVPVYKAEKYLRQCVDSILAQTFEDFELILVDDGSPDGCGAICDEYAAKDPRVRVIHKENGGPVSARKAGIAAAAADYIGFVDSDDWVEPGYFGDLYAGITAAGADIATAELVKHTEPPLLRVRSRQADYSGPEQLKELMRQMFLNCMEPDTSKWLITFSLCDKLFRRALLTDNLPLFDERVTLNEDQLAHFALLADCRKVVLLSGTAKYHYRVTPGTVSSYITEDQTGAFSDFVRAMLAIAGAKGLDREQVDIFLGSTAYTRIYRAAAQPGGGLRERRRYVRRLLAALPDGALEKYARARGSAFIRLFCAMLRAGLITPCLWLIMLHAALTGQKS